MSTLPVLGCLYAMPCLCSDLAAATNVGLASVMGFTGARDFTGATLLWGECWMVPYLHGQSSSTKLVWMASDRHLLHLLRLGHICTCPLPIWKGTWDWWPCPTGISVLGNLSGVATGTGLGIIWRPVPKIAGKNMPVPKKTLSTMSEATANIPVLTPQLHMEFVCSVIELQLTFAVLFALQPRSFLSVHFSGFLSLWLCPTQWLFRDDLLE